MRLPVVSLLETVQRPWHSDVLQKGRLRLPFVPPLVSLITRHHRILLVRRKSKRHFPLRHFIGIPVHRTHTRQRPQTSLPTTTEVPRPRVPSTNDNHLRCLSSLTLECDPVWLVGSLLFPCDRILFGFLTIVNSILWVRIHHDGLVRPCHSPWCWTYARG